MIILNRSNRWFFFQIRICSINFVPWIRILIQNWGWASCHAAMTLGRLFSWNFVSSRKFPFRFSIRKTENVYRNNFVTNRKTKLFAPRLGKQLTLSRMACLMTSRSSSCFLYFLWRSLSACLMASCLKVGGQKLNHIDGVPLLTNDNKLTFDGKWNKTNQQCWEQVQQMSKGWKLYNP